HPALDVFAHHRAPSLVRLDERGSDGGSRLTSGSRERIAGSARQRAALQEPLVSVQPVPHEAVHAGIVVEGKRRHRRLLPTRMSRGEPLSKGWPWKSPKALWMERPDVMNIIEISSRSYPRTRSR